RVGDDLRWRQPSFMPQNIFVRRRLLAAGIHQHGSPQGHDHQDHGWEAFSQSSKLEHNVTFPPKTVAKIVWLGAQTATWKLFLSASWVSRGCKDRRAREW